MTDTVVPSIPFPNFFIFTFPQLDIHHPKDRGNEGKTVHIWLNGRKKKREMTEHIFLKALLKKISLKKKTKPKNSQLVVTHRLFSTLGRVPGSQIWQLSKQVSGKIVAKSGGLRF